MRLEGQVASIGIICGLKSEAKAVRAAFADDRVDVVISGANADRAELLARALCQPSQTRNAVEMIISVGVSGGLLPAYQAGDLIIGKEVVTATGERFACDEAGLAMLQKSHKSAGISPSIIYGSDEVILTTDHKRKIFEQTGAKSVDMESHGAARAAAEAGIPFLAIRAVADPADRALPEAALNAVKPDGGTRVLSTLVKAAQNPIQLSELVQLGSDSKQALKTLGGNLRGLLGVLLLSRDIL